MISASFTPDAFVTPAMIDIRFSTQVNLIDESRIDGGFDGVYLKCTVTQGTSSKPCAYTDNYPALLTSLYDQNASTQTVMTSYNGYAQVDGGQPDVVKS